jgi:iron(III) transport system substrate-binding protein
MHQADGVLRFRRCPEDLRASEFRIPGQGGVEIDPTIAALGDLTIDPLPLVKIAPHRTEASQLVDKVGFDQAM